MLHAADPKPARLMGVAGDDEAEVACGDTVEQPAPRRRGDVAHVDLGVVRDIAEERLVKHHAERTAPATQGFLQPGELLFLLGGAGAEELGVEAHELPRSGFEGPSVGAKQAAIVGEPRRIERMRVGRAGLDRVVADVVIARHEARLLSEPGKDGAGRRGRPDREPRRP